MGTKRVESEFHVWIDHDFMQTIISIMQLPPAVVAIGKFSLRIGQIHLMCPVNQ